MLIKCDNCGEQFNKKPSKIKLSDKHFCSNKCSSESKKVTINVKCDECGIVVDKRPSDLKKTKNGKHFCGRSCAQKYHGKTHRKENHPNWKGENKTSYRTFAFESKPKVCNSCGYDEEVRILQVHYIDHDRSNNNLDNLEILCPNCHAVKHLVEHETYRCKPK